LALDPDLAAAIAVTRFGLGAKPGQIALARPDPQAWLTDQIRIGGADQPQARPQSSIDRILGLREYRIQRRDATALGDPKSDPVKMALKMIHDETGSDFIARVQLGSTTDADFRERWALFWCNHFTVSATKLQTALLVGPFEQEAIRPNVFRRFEDLLVASSSHPGMLFYLDQAESVGPDTVAATFMSMGGKKAGLNENLAREILELHTIGVDAGYTQADVTEFARAMTGWSVGGFREGNEAGRFLFRTAAHEGGPRTIMGKTYSQGGMQQALAVMKDLAASPKTAHHISVKLAKHFVADDPPPTLVAKLERTYLGTDGDLTEVAKTLVLAQESWGPDAVKFKTPYEFMISSFRAGSVLPQALEQIGPALNGMGQKPFDAPSPKGWADDAEIWCAPDAVIKRMAWSEAYAAKALDGRDPSQLAADALGARLTPLVARAISRAETREEGMAILLMSPEFQRR
jgi:uncharacterized protein (DUF1800 family)